MADRIQTWSRGGDNAEGKLAECDILRKEMDSLIPIHRLRQIAEVFADVLKVERSHIGDICVDLFFKRYPSLSKRQSRLRKLYSITAINSDTSARVFDLLGLTTSGEKVTDSWITDEATVG